MATFESKVFGIGLQRTGTTSLAKALNILGYRAVHWGFSYNAMLGFETWFKGNFAVNEMLGIDAGTDNPFPIFFRELDASYPGSKFILTTRNKESWLMSCEKLYANNNFLCCSDYVQANHTKLYGIVDFDPKVFAQVYDRHHTTVLQYFECMPNKLLVIDFNSGNIWEKLCLFLGKSVPQQDFPWENRSKPYLTFDRSSKLQEAIAVASDHTARKICSILYDYYRPRRVVDVCGNAREWHKTFLEQGSTVICTSAESGETDTLQTCNSPRDKDHDLALFLDTASELATYRDAVIVRRLVSLSDIVLLASGGPDQSGVDQPLGFWQAHWTALFAQHNYGRVTFIPPQPWNDKQVMGYYRNSILLFAAERKQALFREGSPVPLGLIDKLILQRNGLARETAINQGRL